MAHEHLPWDLGDLAFVDVPTVELTDPGRNAALAEQIPDDGLVPVEPGQPRGGLDPNTTHITVVDAEGTLVSMTHTLTSPRFHLEGATLQLEDGVDAGVADALLACGYAGVERPPSPYHVGSVQALEVDDDAGTVTGARHTRREADSQAAPR